MADDLPQSTTQDAGTNAADASNANLLNRQLSAIIESLSDGSSSSVTILDDIAAAITSSVLGGVVGTTANALLRTKTVSSGSSAGSLQNSTIVCDNSGNLSPVGNITFTTGSALRTNTSAGNTLLLQAYDVDGVAYTTFGTLTANNTPTFDLAAAVTKGGVGIATLNTNTWIQQQGFAAVALTDASTITWNAQTAQSAKVLLTSGVGATRALGAPSNLVDGFTYILRVQQSSTGSNALTYNTVYKWPGGVAPTLSTANNAIDILTFTSDGTNMYGVAQKAFS